MKFNKLKLLLLFLVLPVVGCNQKITHYVEFKKIATNLYETTVSDYDYDYLLSQRYTNIDFLNGGCSAIRKGNYVGRNFDFVYGDIGVIIVKTPHTKDRFATVAVTSGLFWLTTGAIENRKISDDKLKILPLCVLDGINENGVMIEINCVNAADFGGKTTSTNSGAPELSQSVVVRYLLDKSTSADHAISLLRSKDIVSKLEMDVMGLTSKGFEVHFLISDANKSYVVELNNSKPDKERMVVLEYQKEAIMTNFYLHASDIKNDVFPDHSLGVERYKKLDLNKDSVVSLQTCKDIMQSIKYTNSNRLDGEYTPGLGLTCYSDHPTFDENPICYGNYKQHIPEIEASMKIEGAYTTKFLKGEVKDNPNMYWCTCFTSCYDLQNLSFDIAIYEKYDHYYHFSLK